MKKYEYVVSLGHFCSPAMELERIGRRSFSLPFDWLITPEMSVVMELIENGFEDFMSEEHLYQIKEYPKYYRNVSWNIDFYHDFSLYKSFSSQFEAVKQKYDRRIKRFYEAITKPTLFLRYITEKDVESLTSNYDAILKKLQKFNPDNLLILVSNSDLPRLAKDIPIYYVDKDEGDSVARQFLNKNDDLLRFITESVEESASKITKHKSKLKDLTKKVYQKARIKLGLYYHHDKQC